MSDIRAPMTATLVQWLVQPGTLVQAGQALALLEAMKMEHEVTAPCAGVLAAHGFAAGELVNEGDLLSKVEQQSAISRGLGTENTAKISEQMFAGTVTGSGSGSGTVPHPRPHPALHPGADPAAAGAAEPEPEALRRWRARQAATLDSARPQAMQRRHAAGALSARENIAALCDPGTFVEYGALALAAQRSRRSEEDLVAHTPADGLVCGVGQVGGHPVALLAYDATVLAGTQGLRNHQKMDRLLEQALQQRWPVVLWAEGGGGRPGDVDFPIVAGLHVPTFARFAQLHGRVPVLGIAAGRCFAGNAALLGCCEIIVATRSSNIGMGGPAMIEGGGLGVFAPEAIGPAPVQHANGVIDVLAEDEREAATVARQYLALALSPLREGAAAPTPDAAALATLVPAQRNRSFDSTQAVRGLADAGSVLWLRTGFGRAVHTALGRIEGRAVGWLVSNPAHLGGAIDPDAADKVARFTQLCSARGWPIVSLVDTPGFMVGPEVEADAQVRHAGRLFVASAQRSVPQVAVLMRRAFGLGAMALCGGGFHTTLATAAWPQAECGAMGLEGAVRLGYRKELEALPEGPERQARFDALLQQHIAAGSAVNMATTLEIDAVIAPQETRTWVARLLRAAAPVVGAARPVDTR